jgi:hypothetical protein
MELREYGIAELREQFDRREATAVELCNAFLTLVKTSLA